MSRQGRFPDARHTLVPPGRPAVRFQHRAANRRPPQAVEHHGERRRRLHLLRVERSRLDVGRRAHRGAIHARDHHHPAARHLKRETRRSGPFDVQRERSSTAQRGLEQTRERNDGPVS